MTIHLSLEDLARQVLQSHWDRFVQDRARDDASSCALAPEVCPLLWLVPEFLNLVLEEHDRPIHELEPIIRRLIDEADFVDENGDTTIGATTHGHEVEEQARLVVAMLMELRASATEHGQWSDAPVTPIMFG